MLFVFALLACQSIGAQAIVEEAAVTAMMRQYVEFNQSHQEVRGWRIQVLVTTDRRQLDKTKSNFEYKYPGYELLFSHENPFYHLKTGAFISQQDARSFLEKIRRDYSGAFIVADDIELSEVLKYR